MNASRGSALRLLLAVSLFALEFTGAGRFERLGANGPVEGFGPGELVHALKHPARPFDENRPHMERTSCRVVPVDQAWRRKDAPPALAAVSRPLDLPRAVRAAEGGSPLSFFSRPVLPGHLRSKK